MTDVSVRMYDKICKYCGNCDGKHCLKDVPYYAVSFFCDYFTEREREVVKKINEGRIRRKVLRSLVETF
jgi:hypothetical protein